MPPPWLYPGALEQPVGRGGLAGRRCSSRNASVKKRGAHAATGVLLPDAPGQGLRVGEGEASRLSAGGQVSPGPQCTGSHPPQEEVVCAVISAHSLTAATAPTAEPEVLIAVTSTDNQHFRPSRGGASVSRGVPVLQGWQLLRAWGTQGRIHQPEGTVALLFHYELSFCTPEDSKKDLTFPMRDISC